MTAAGRSRGYSKLHSSISGSPVVGFPRRHTDRDALDSRMRILDGKVVKGEHAMEGLDEEFELEEVSA